MSLSFHHVTLGQRVLFGHNRAADHLAAEVTRLGADRVMVITTPRGREHAEQVAADIAVTVWHDDVVMHVPAEVAERARRVAVDGRVDLAVAVGGGSAVGLAKAVSLSTGIPSIAVPTTYAGSEATDVWGLTEGGVKTTGSDPAVLPVTVIYDSALSRSLPVDLSVASGLNGLAHCVDSLWAPRADPINAALAVEGARALVEGLPLIVADPHDIRGRDLALYGAYLAAVSFASAGPGMHHKLCHILGGTFNLPHAQTHATVLPHVLAFNIGHAPAAAARLRSVFGADDAVEALGRLRLAVDAPAALQDHGFTAQDIPAAVEQALATIPASNPRTVTADNLTALLTAALHGDDPTTIRG